MNSANLRVHIVFAGLLFSALSLQGVGDDTIIVNKDESKVKKVLTSKKFWGTIAGLGLVAGGIGALWVWYKASIAKEIKGTAENLENSLKESSDIHAYKIQVYQWGSSKYNEYIVNLFGGEVPQKPYAVDTIILKSNKGPYVIAIGLISDLENPSQEELHQGIVKPKSETLANRIINRYQQEGFSLHKHDLKIEE